nr:cell wall-binding repeat-containing protein [Mobiluncus sp. Marseille-Q7826]
MNLKKKFVIGAASVALVAGMGGVAAPAAVAVDGSTLPAFANTLQRLGGMDRVQTSLAVADKQFGALKAKKPTRLYIASAAEGNMVDAAAAGMLQDGPIVFVYNNSYVAAAVGEHFKNYTAGEGYQALSEVVAIGGDGAISDGTLKAVADSLKVAKTARLGGKDRYETSVKIAEEIYAKGQRATTGGNSPYFDRNQDFIVNAATSNLKMVYLANGDDKHVVDSMVAGTLDNGPVLLVQPDGKIPEVVSEFIKKTLPEQFAALGAAETLPDSTVQEAWLIKTLANKWDTSYDIPQLKKDVDNLNVIVNGKGKSSIYGASDFKGMVAVARDAQNMYSDWNGRYAILTGEINNTYIAQEKKGTVTLDDAVTDLLNTSTTPGKAFNALFGTYFNGLNGRPAKNADLVKGYFSTVEKDGVVYATLFDVDRFVSDKLGSDVIEPAEKALNKIWTTTPVQDTLTALDVMAAKGEINATSAAVAKASQNFANSTLVATSGTKGKAGSAVDPAVPLAAVQPVSKFTLDAVNALRDQKVKELNTKQQQLRNELDKIAPKTELRLGGKDRFETAQLIANQFGKIYGHTLNKELATVRNGAVKADFNEAYIASGYRLADSLAAGQLATGPILLVKGTEKDAKDLPDFTKNVATNLACWTANQHLNLFGIGGSGVLSDDSLQVTMGQINNSSCTVKGAKANYSLYAKDVTVPLNGNVDSAVTPSSTTPTVASVKDDGGNDASAKFTMTPAVGKVTVAPKAAPNAPALGEYAVTIKDGAGHDYTFKVTVVAAAAPSPAYAAAPKLTANTPTDFAATNATANPAPVCTANTSLAATTTDSADLTQVTASVDAACKVTVKDGKYADSGAEKHIVLKIANTGSTNPVTLTVTTKQ